MHQQLLFKLDQNPKGRGLRCDSDGLFLGRNALLQRNGEGNFEPRPVDEVQKLLIRAYGVETNWESCIRSVRLVASALNEGNLARAMITAVLMRLPDPRDAIRTSDGVLAKAGYNPDEPRDERGRWTTGGSSTGEADLASHNSDDRTAADALTPAQTTNQHNRAAEFQLADANVSDASDDPVRQVAARSREAAQQVLGVARPTDDLISELKDGRNIVVSAAEDEDSKDPRFGTGGSHPPPEELIPQRLQQSPAGPAVEFLDNLLDITCPGDEANLVGTVALERALLEHIHQVDPNYVFATVEPQGGLAAMSWQERSNLVIRLRAELAATIYRVRGDIKPLQEVTLDFLQRTANAAYDEAVQRYRAGRLNVRLSAQEAIGNFVDATVLFRLRSLFNDVRISIGSGSVVRVNRRAYNTLDKPVLYRLPDARVGNLAFDVSLTAKMITSPQIKGFFNADFRPIAVVIVRPNQLGSNSSYIIWRPKGW